MIPFRSSTPGESRDPPPGEVDPLEPSLAFLGIEEDGLRLLEEMAPGLAPLLPGIVDRFFDRLSRFPEFARFTSDPEFASRLRRSQLHYLQSLISSRPDDAYRAERARLVRAHEREGLPPQACIDSYRILCRELVAASLRVCDGDAALHARLSDAIMGKVFLDIHLALTVFTRDREDALAAENRRAEAERRSLRRIIEGVDAVLLEVDPDSGRYHYVSPKAEEMFGIPPAEWEGGLEGFWYPRLHPEDREAVRSASATAAAQGRGFSIEYRFRRADDSWAWVREVATPCEGDGGQGRTRTGVLLDVTPRKAAEADLLRTHERLLEAQRLGKLGNWEWEVSGDALSWSHEVHRIFGLDPGSVRITRGGFIERVHPEDRERVEAALIATLEDGAARGFDHRILLPTGGQRWVHEEVEAVRDGKGRVLHLAGTVQDVSDRMKAEEELRTSEERLYQAQKMEAIGKFAGSVAHDFNNILTAIGGFSELCVHETPAVGKAHRYLGEVQKATARATDLTRQLLAFSRKQVLRPRVLDLNGVVKEMEGMLRRLIGEQIRIDLALAEDLGAVHADPGQMTQVIMNLVVNARDAMPKGGTLTIGTSNAEIPADFAGKPPLAKPGPCILLAVTDTGEGMDDGTKARIFEPFFTTKPKGRGTGLGLATVYGIVKQSGGHIWVYSEPGRGTTFKIHLPRVAREPEEAVVAEEAPAVRGTETILLAEDEEAVRRYTVEALSALGYRVLPVGDVAEVGRAMDGHGGPVHLVLTDVVLPGGSGVRVADAVRRRYPGAAVLYMSGYTEATIVRGGNLRPGVRFLEKPFSSASLANRVRAALDGGMVGVAR